MTVLEEAVVAAHSAICEDSLEDCLEWHGRCVKALEASAPHLMAQAWDEGYDAADYDAPHSGKTDNPYLPEHS